jgi:hypothetical protein
MRDVPGALAEVEPEQHVSGKLRRDAFPEFAQLAEVFIQASVRVGTRDWAGPTDRYWLFLVAHADLLDGLRMASARRGQPRR